MKHKRHRGRIQIIRDVLYALQHTETTTHLVYRTNTSNTFVNPLLSHLEKQGLIIRTKRSKGYGNHLTQKGRLLIKDFRRVDDALQLENFEKEVK